jgi:uncharacterized protein YwgA
MNAETLILAVLHAIPHHEVRGRKRLQKLSFFAVQAGAQSNVRFFLHDFGPFSSEVAAATDFLAFLGDVAEEEIQFGRTKRYMKLYRLENEDSVAEKLPEQAAAALKSLNDYSTLELEIASTIRYFMSKGMASDTAIDETKQLKPSKSEPKIIVRALEALSKVGLYERRREDQVPSTRSH